MNAVSSPTDALAAPLAAIEQQIARRELTEASQRLATLMHQAPGDPRIYLLGSRLAHAAGDDAQSVAIARRGWSTAPDWGLAAAELALALARNHEFNEAVAMAEKAVELDGDTPAVLTGMINVAQRAQRLELVQAWLERAARLLPDNMAIRRRIAQGLQALQRPAEAVAAYGAILQSSPGDAAARLGRLQAALDAGDTATAQQDGAALVAAEPANPLFLFWAALARGETPPHQPAAMIAALYDGLAGVYDRHAVGGLKYKLPELVAARVLQWHPDRKLNLLDLGCGTGLLGGYVGRIDGVMFGVDLSRPMIDEAMRRNTYQTFHQGDLFGALQGTSEAQYDVIAALDVFTYAGALDEAVRNAHRILKPGGRLVLSCERAAEGGADLVLQPSMRYAHRQAAVEAACLAAGFARVEIEPLVLREEDNAPVAGFLVVARKDA
jgi:predicted TPR repeat methyltransferase